MGGKKINGEKKRTTKFKCPPQNFYLSKKKKRSQDRGAYGCGGCKVSKEKRREVKISVKQPLL